MLQQKHDNTIKNIQELQELEKYMFQNLQNINKADASAASEAAIIQTRINELSAMRQNLFHSAEKSLHKCSSKCRRWSRGFSRSN